MHGDIGQDLPVQFDAGELQPVHELRIGQAFGADAGVDALDPQSPEAALLNLAVAIGVLAGLFDGLTRDANRVLATAIIALRLIQNPLVLRLGGYTTLYSCHVPASLLQAVRRPLAHVGNIGIGKHGSAAIGANILRVVADQPVALARDSMLHLASGGELEALLYAALRLELGHFRLLMVRRLRMRAAALDGRRIPRSRKGGRI